MTFRDCCLILRRVRSLLGARRKQGERKKKILEWRAARREDALWCGTDGNGANAHVRTDAKLDSKHQLPLLNELCDLSNCNNALFFEARRKHNDLYLWAAKAPNGPSVRFHVLNAHTMDELKMTGNCLKGSRPIVVFDKAFDESAHMRVIKEVLSNVGSLPCVGRRKKLMIGDDRFSQCQRRQGGRNRLWITC